MYPTDNIIFANGGDRSQDNIPEMTTKGIEFVFKVGGDDKKFFFRDIRQLETS